MTAKTKTPALSARKAAALKKAAPKKKAAVKKAASKKAASKKAVVKKSAAQKTMTQKSVVKKSAVKKGAIKKGAIKKAVVKKAAAKKSMANKSTVKTAAPKKFSTQSSRALCDFAERILDDMKARDIRVLDVQGMTGITDYMVIASGTSERHVRSIAVALISEAKKAGLQILGSEGEQGGEWALVDLGDVIVHVMQSVTRDFYNLEKLWSVPANTSKTTADD